MNKKHILKIDNRDEVNGRKSILNLQNIRKVYSKEGVDFLLANLAPTGPTGTSSIGFAGTTLTFTDNAGGTTSIDLASLDTDTQLTNAQVVAAVNAIIGNTDWQTDNDTIYTDTMVDARIALASIGDLNDVDITGITDGQIYASCN